MKLAFPSGRPLPSDDRSAWKAPSSVSVSSKASNYTMIRAWRAVNGRLQHWNKKGTRILSPCSSSQYSSRIFPAGRNEHLCLQL